MPRLRSLRAALIALAGCALCAVALPARGEGPAGGGHAGSLPPRRLDESGLQSARSLPVNDGHHVDADAAVRQPIVLSAQFAQQWEDGESDALLLRGGCRIAQGDTTLTARQMVIWRRHGSAPSGRQRLVAYLEGDVLVERGYRREQRHALCLELSTEADVRFDGPREPLTGVSAADDPLYERALEQRQALRRSDLQPTQLIVPPPAGASPLLPPVLPPIAATVQRHVSINPRYLGQPLSANMRVSDTVPPEFIISVTRGVNIVVDNVPVVIQGVTVLATLDLTADNAVIWTDAELDNFGSFDLSPGSRLQVYLEGNIIVRQGMNEARASHAFYDVNEERGLMMNAEVRAFLPQLETWLRLRAEQVRQLSQTNFHARNAWVTTSQMGRPGYRIEASDIFVEERTGPGAGRIDPFTGAPQGGSLWVRSHNNRFYLEEVPLLYVPYLAAPADQQQFPVRRVVAGYDGIFGLKVETLWSLEGLFGLELPENADWDLELNGYTRRGPMIGTRADYDFDSFLFGLPVHHFGLARLNYIYDEGRDNLGLGRRSLAVPDENRGRALVRHRTTFPFGTQLDAELGFLSDRNFLDQYYEPEWDRDKDYESLVRLSHQADNLSIAGMVRGRLYDFDYVTEWLPRGDLTVLGEPLLGDWLTWSSRSSVGYGRIHPADAPTDPADVFTPLPFFPDAEGVVAVTRHELNLPLNVGPVNVVPYVLGEAAYWQEGFTGGDVARLYGSAGVRASLMFWKVRPELHSPVLGLNGLAHKMVFDLDYYFADSSEPLANIPQYNEFDENAQERFRTRFFTLSYGGVLPPLADPRYYAVRAGAARGVADPYHELVDRQHVMRMGWRHRWQTKVGPPDRPRIKDWMTLDLEASWFPNADRDNFGEPFGLIGGRYSWAVGERTTLLADALFDIFDQGQEMWTVGILSQRSMRGSVYLGFRQVKVGPIESQLLAASFSYAMSPKWASTFGTTFDVAEGMDRGQSLMVTRIGEYALIHVGLGYNRSRNNFGFALSVEPRFGASPAGSPQLSSLLGVR